MNLAPPVKIDGREGSMHDPCGRCVRGRYISSALERAAFTRAFPSYAAFISEFNYRERLEERYQQEERWKRMKKRYRRKT